jgi:hypothetical protein
MPVISTRHFCLCLLHVLKALYSLHHYCTPCSITACRQYDQRETPPGAPPDQHTLWLWRDADWRRWEGDDRWAWSGPERHVLAERLFRQQARREVERTAAEAAREQARCAAASHFLCVTQSCCARQQLGVCVCVCGVLMVCSVACMSRSIYALGVCFCLLRTMIWPGIRDELYKRCCLAAACCMCECMRRAAQPTSCRC